jgi:signal transduction histidine kinase/ligand-binding sensor domain-containing protein
MSKWSGRFRGLRAPRFFGICVLLVLLTSTAFGQIAVDSWTADNGLPQNVIRSVCQTPDGYLWLATFDGLVRFDGVRFITFNKSNTTGLNGNRFTSLFCTAAGDLWAATEGSGVVHYHGRHFQSYSILDGLLSNAVSGLASDDHGNIWALAEGAIHRWDSASRRFTALSPEKYRHYAILSSEGHSGFARISEETVDLFAGGRELQYPLPAGWPRGVATTASMDVNHNLWLANALGGLTQIVNGRWMSVFYPAAGRHSLAAKTGFRSDYRDTQGNTWTSEVEWNGSMLVRYLLLPQGTQPAKIAFTSLYEDREGSIWLATDGQGLFRLRAQTIRGYSKEQGLPDGNVYPIYETRDRTVWIGTWSGGLARFRDGKIKTYTTADGLASNRVYAIFEDRDGVLWVSVEQGLYRMRNERFEPVTGHGINSSDLLVRAIHQNPTGAMWFGTGGGLLRLEQGQWTRLTTKDGLATNDARVIIDGRDGNLWVGGYGGLSSVRDGKARGWTEQDGLAGNMVRSLYEDAAGVLWIGTYDSGLGRLEGGRLTKITQADGLFNNGAFQILEDSRSNLWMSCNRGIYHISKSQLNDFAAGKSSAVTSIPYGRRDGMKNTECNGGLWPAGFRARDGKLWFPTQDGVAVIDPDRMEANPKPPPVVIESCSIDRVPTPIDRPVRVAPGSESFEIQYTALSLIDSERILFKYQLEGLDHDWVLAGRRRSAYYPHVPPGSYTFRVTAARSDGTWNDAVTRLSVVVLPPYYQTWWFAMLLSLTAASCIWLAWRRRLGQVERAHLAQQAFSRQLIATQESEKKRIAAELHDSLGQSLAIIKNLAMLALSNVNGDSETRRHVDEISAESSRAIQEVRQISYNLRPYQLDRLGLRNAILAMLRTTAKVTAARLTTDVGEIDDFFPRDAEINFYRIVQECLNNVVKHSAATEVVISIERLQDSLSLTIRDNGKGFTPGTPASDPMRGGFGLVGIRERAELLGGTASIQTAPGEGTKVYIHIAGGPVRHG